MSNDSSQTPDADSPKGTLVTGDFIIDQHIYEGGRYHYADRTPGVLVKVETGGAGKLADLLTRLFEPSKDDKLEHARKVVPARTPPDALINGATASSASTSLAHHAYAFWRPQPNDETRDKQKWRCTEAMGFGALRPEEHNSTPDDASIGAVAETPPAGETCPTRNRESGIPCASWDEPDDRPRNPALVVISEGGMGFRENAACWTELPFDQTDQIILKTARNPTEGELWKRLADHKDKLTVIISAAELRKLDARISSGLTWDETFHDFLREIDDNAPDGGGRLSALKQCKNLIVAFDSEAAIAIQMATAGVLSGATVTFAYHASSIEEDTKNKTQGTAFGLLTCFAAAVTLAIARNDDLGEALESGLSAMQDLLLNGHGAATDRPDGFPVERIAKVILDPKGRFTRVTFPYDDVAPSNHWSFLGLAEPTAVNKKEAAFEFARLTAKFGPVALMNLPHLSIGKLFTVDSEEVTALRSLSHLLRRYNKQKKAERPLSIGVFGPPGAGKSFAVKEIAPNLLDKRSECMDFNLSQFAGPEDLIGAFHQIRDKVLQGKLPIAFFDEFDSRRYEWLQYLLAPMQDGKFQEGNVTHAIGKCIFIFAGGTSWTFDTFGPPDPASGAAPGTQPDAETDRRAKDDYLEFRLAKGPDFQSRLDGYLNVVGPNPRVRRRRPKDDATAATRLLPGSAAVGGLTSPGSPIQTKEHRVGNWTLVEDEDDIWWPIRRALMLRSTLKLEPDEMLDIDPGLLRALLEVPRYIHGSRSMEKILLPMLEAKTFRPSFVPHRSQLELHTDAGEFLKLLATGDLAQPSAPVGFTEAEHRELKNAIAPKIHQTWYDLTVRSGNETGEFKQLKVEMAECERGGADWTRLLSNYGAAARIPELLAIVGLRLVRDDASAPAMSNPSGNDLRVIRQRLEFHLELLASEEHRGWMDWYLKRGWTYHPDAKRSERQHKCLIPYSELKEPDKAKDRTSIQHFIDFLRGTGFHIEHARCSGAECSNI